VLSTKCVRCKEAEATYILPRPPEAPFMFCDFCHFCWWVDDWTWDKTGSQSVSTFSSQALRFWFYIIDPILPGDRSELEKKLVLEMVVPRIILNELVLIGNYLAWDCSYENKKSTLQIICP